MLAASNEKKEGGKSEKKIINFNQKILSKSSYNYCLWHKILQF